MLMTFRKYIPAVHIHPILLVFMIIAFLTGMFMELSIILLIVFFHELGHYMISQIFKWRVESIMLWVFGGVMKTDEHGNRTILEEALVTIAGPFQHVIIYILLLFLSAHHIFPAHILELIGFYNTTILIFNLLPIWPLDGGKLLFISLSALYPYRRAYHMTIVFSMILSIVLLCCLFFYPFTFSVFLIMIFLFMENRTEWKQRYYVFIRFLLKRYEGSGVIKAVLPLSVSSGSSLMDVFSLFRRERKHSIYINYPDQQRKLIDENDCLRSYFFDKEYREPIGKIADKLSRV